MRRGVEDFLVSAGLRRAIMVVGAPRSQLPEYGTFVEAVGRALQQLPECTAQCRLDAPAQATASNTAPPSPVAAIFDCIAQWGSEVGMLHLALHESVGGPVLAWQGEVLAVAEPGTLLEDTTCLVKYMLYPITTACTVSLCIEIGRQTNMGWTK